ncbi:MAG: MFS transporter [Armatimonadota bacterium]|nr:MFS transporter [Armatimonadota bacterium]MDR5697475.1 MFS transporter [Armatimonadota bacterium]
MFGLTLISQAFGTYLLFYYVDVLGLPAGLAAMARIAYTAWDVFNDPLTGYLSDRTRSRWGRRRPWLVVGLPFYLLFFLMAFWVPGGLREEVLFWYLLTVVLLFEGAATAVWTNFSALFPEIFRGLRSRARAAAWKHGAQIAGLIAGVALTPLAYDTLGFGGMALVYALVGAVTMGPVFATTPEDRLATDPRPLGLLAALRHTLGNRPFWLFLAAQGLVQAAFGVMVAGMAFYARYTLALDARETSALFTAVFAVALAAVVPWSRAAARRGGKTVWASGIGAVALAVLPLAAARDLWTGVAAGAAVGLALGGVLVGSEVVLAYIIDRDAQATGRRREALHYSINGLITRLAITSQALAFALLTPLFGYVSGTDPGPAPGAAFRFFMTVLPFCALAAAWAVARRFPHAADDRIS